MSHAACAAGADAARTPQASGLLYSHVSPVPEGWTLNMHSAPENRIFSCRHPSVLTCVC